MKTISAPYFSILSFIILWMHDSCDTDRRDAGQERCRAGRMQDRRDAGQKDAGKVGCRTGD